MRKIREEQGERWYRVEYQCDSQQNCPDKGPSSTIKIVSINCDMSFSHPVTGKLELRQTDLEGVVDSFETIEFADGQLVNRIYTTEQGLIMRMIPEGELRIEKLAEFARAFQIIFRTNPVVDYWIENFEELRPYLD